MIVYASVLLGFNIIALLISVRKDDQPIYGIIGFILILPLYGRLLGWF